MKATRLYTRALLTRTKYGKEVNSFEDLSKIEVVDYSISQVKFE
ncbi:MAG: hypothetical protein ACP6KW_03690 [Candidatus Thorarchaeota archaeon]